MISSALHFIQKKRTQKIDLTRLDHAMVFIALLSPATMIPQIVKIFITQDASSMSLSAFTLKLLVIIPWLIYGFYHKSVPILCSNTIWFIVSAIIVAQVIVY